MDREIFVDTAYAIAFSSPKDLFHPQAVPFAQKLKADTLFLNENVQTERVSIHIEANLRI